MVEYESKFFQKRCDLKRNILLWLSYHKIYEHASKFITSITNRIFILTTKDYDSVKMLAQLLRRKPEEKIMESIIEIHQIERSMHPALIKYRTDIMNRLLKMADRVFSNAKDIHAAF